MALPEGAHYQPGSGRKYVTLADGSVVKRQEAENMAITAKIPGIRNRYQLRKLREYGHTDKGRAMRDSQNYRRDLQKTTDLFARGDRRGRSEQDFDDLSLQLSREYRDSGGRLDKSPDSALAHYLIATGARNPGADYNVGDTPNVK